MTIKGGRFENNAAEGPGGAIFFRQAPMQRKGLTISGATFVGNKALNGGAIFLSKTTTRVGRGWGGGYGARLWGWLYS